MAPFPSPTKTWHTEAYASISANRPELCAKGKVVLITGGGTGIGRETARTFAQAGAARIALLGRREQPLLDTKTSIEQDFAGTEVFTASVDVTEKSDVDTAFASFAGDAGIDLVVSAAAMIGPQDPVAGVDAEQFLASVQVNLAGALNVAQAFIRHAAEEAIAVDINSSAAHINFGPGFSAYSVAKLGVYRLWDSLAVGNPNLSIFHVQPGIVNTDMNKESGGAAAMGFGDHVNLPASFVLFLASPEARFLKGKFLWANWDVDELKARAETIATTEELSIQVNGWPFGSGKWSSTWDDEAAKSAKKTSQ